MSKARHKRYSSDVAQLPALTRRRGTWLRVGVLVAVLGCMAAAIAYQLHYMDSVAASPTSKQESASATVSQEPLPEIDRQKLVGRWQRADANYVLEINRVAPNGQLDAAYLNPKPIHVSKAIAATESGKTTVMVELRDRLYPGSFYTLTYNPHDDRLLGVYHHLGVQQDFDVVFVRME
jgi:hypothetical protein